MSMRKDDQMVGAQWGFTLTELLVVIVIIGIVSTLAVMQFGAASNRLKRQNVAQELKSSFERARFDSVKRRALSGLEAYVVVTAGSFTLRVDADQDGVMDADDDRTNSYWDPTVSIRQQNGAALSGPVTVTFNRRGEVSVSGGPAVFLVCNGDCSTPDVGNSNLVVVTATGTVNLLAGGATVPSFAAPGSISTVPASSGINDDVIIP